MAERSGLTEETALDAVRLHLVQIPLAAWVVPVFAATFLTFFLAAAAPLFGPIAVVLFLALFVGMFAMGVYKPRAEVEIGPAEIRIKGWIGALPRPDEAVLPIVGTRLDTRRGAQVNNIQVWVVTLTHGEHKVVLPSLRCTSAELEELRERIEGMRLLAESLHGEGPEEIPEDLDALRAAPRPQSESER